MGGCFPVQQTDTTPLDGNNDPSNIKTAQASDAITKQIAQNKQDLATAEKAIADSSADALTDEGKQNADVVNAIISADPETTSSTSSPNSNSNSNAGKNKGGNATKAQSKKGSENNKRAASSPRWARRRAFDILEGY